ncbi:MAG: hypothetical protein AAF242_12830 [Bacteroidota bacterium]
MTNSILDEDFQKNPLILDRATVLKINSLKTRINFGLKDLRYARNASIFLCIFSVISLGIAAAIQPEGAVEIAIEGAVLAIFYLIAGIRVGKHPTRWLYSVIIVFSLYWLLTIIVDVTYIYRGIILKGIIYYYLIKGLEGARAVSSGLDEMTALGVPNSDLLPVERLEDLKKSVVPQD